jgi:predicted Zn-dependent protease
VRAAVVGLLALAVVAGAGGERTAWAATETTAQSRRPVVLVPLGSFPKAEAAALARFVRAKAGVPTRVAARKSIPRSMFNRGRKQYVAEKLITLLSRPVGDRSVVIGLTLEDMYMTSLPYRFTFSIRGPAGWAVVSRARMDPVALGLNADPALRMRRLQKMVLKSVGTLALGRRVSGNPRSVLFDGILSADDLDYMTTEFRPAKPSGARKTWLARSDKACKAGITEQKAVEASAQLDTQEGTLSYLRESIALRNRHRSELAAVPASPKDRSQMRALVARFKRAVAADQKALAKLEASWSDATLRALALERGRFAFALKADALELGSLGCGRYFDPLTYAG